MGIVQIEVDKRVPEYEHLLTAQGRCMFNLFEAIAAGDDTRSGMNQIEAMKIVNRYMSKHVIYEDESCYGNSNKVGRRWPLNCRGESPSLVQIYNSSY